MDMAFLLKIGGIGIIVAILYQILKKYGSEEQANFVSVAGIIIVMFFLIDQIVKLFETVQTLFGI